MATPPSGPGSVQGPVTHDSGQDVQEKPDVSGKHGHRKVEEATPEKQILVKPRTSPKKRLAEFKSIKPVTPEQKQVTSQKAGAKTESSSTQQPSSTSPPPEEGLETLRGEDRYHSREDILRTAKKSKAWQKLEKQITKKGGLTSKKRFGKLLMAMPKMDFGNKKTVNLMALFAIDKFDSGKFTEAQMRNFMDVVLDCYVQAKANEQVNQALLMLPSAPKKGSKARGLGRTAILAEIAAMTAEKNKGEDAREAAFRALKTDLQTDLYGRDSPFLAELTKQFSGRVTKINEKIAEGMQREMGRLLVEETGSKKRKMSPQQTQKMVDDVDLMVKQFVESQMREKKQKIDNKTASGEELAPITDVVLQKAAVRRAGMIAELCQTTGPELQTAFEQHEVPETRQPEKVVDAWLKDNEGAKKLAETRESAELQTKPDTRVHNLDAWVDQMVELVPQEQKYQVDDEFKEELREQLELAAEAMDIIDDLLPDPDKPSSFSRNEPQGQGASKAKPDHFKPVQKVTETLEEKESPVVPEKTGGTEKPIMAEKKTPPKVAPKPIRKAAAETPASKKHRELEGDGLVPTLIRRFEQILENEKARADRENRPVPTRVQRPKD